MDKPLTIANWTPDVVASILGTVFGLYAAMFFLFLDFMIPFTPVRLFGLLIILMVAYAFNRIVFHMELEGRRHFQQAFTMLIPVAVIYFTTTLLARSVTSIIKTKVSNTVSALNPLNIITGAKPAQAEISLSYQGPAFWTSALAFVILLPFLVHAIKTREFRPAWLLYLLVPAIVCVLVFLVADVTVRMMNFL